VLLRSFERWGPGCVERLRGLFAFAIFDREQDALFLARDQLGIKPLYVTETRSGFAFASELRPLLDLVPERRLDEEGVAAYLSFGSFAEPGTIIRGIRMLPAGTWLLRTEHATREERYWDIPVRAGPSFRDRKSAVQALRAELREAVRMQLVGDVPLGIFLSGGIDSSLVVALAAEVAEQRLRTITVGFEEAVYDESRYAAHVARAYGCEHVAVGLSAERAAAEIDEAVAALDQPSSDGINTYFVAKATRAAGITVALSGLGGDELFAGYHHFQNFRTLAQLAPLLRVLRWFPGDRVVGKRRALSADQHLLKLLGLLGSGGSGPRVYGSLRSMYSPAQVAALLPGMAHGDVAVHVPRGLGARAIRLDPVTCFGALDLANYMRNTLLRDTDVMSMAHALEVRVPLIDHRVVELAMAIPGEMKLGVEPKPLLAAAAPSLPDSTVKRKKMGFALPFDSWLRGRLRPWMEERLLGEPMRKLGIVDTRAVAQLWGRYLRGEGHLSHARVWCLATLADWCQRHRVAA
jgi:asparagine synthase (glutamine-hydrolysing)